MQGVNCVKGEIHNVLTVLRLHENRPCMDSFSTSEEENSLIRPLKDLYGVMGSVSDLSLFDTRAYLQPFLNVIVSDNTDVQTTGIALQSVHKFLMYGHIHQDSPHVAEAVSSIVHYATHCQWDGGRKEESEVVHMKILEVLLECLRCDAGDLLTNEAVCSMITECFSVRSRSGVSKLLRKYAENMLMQMVLVIFSRLTPETQTGGVVIDPNASFPPLDNSMLQRSRSGEIKAFRQRSAAARKSVPGSSTAPASKGDGSDVTKKAPEAYGIPAMHRVFRFLINLINPADPKNDEATKVLGLRLIRTVFETAGKRLGQYRALVDVVQNELCKFLLQNSQTKDIYVLSLVLRIVFDMFATVKKHLKVQLEVFFSSIHLRIGESQSAPFEHKVMVAESLLDFCKEPSIIVGLYCNYDCEVGSTNLFEDFCKFLAQTSVPQAEPTVLHILSFECVLAVLDSIAKRFCVEVDMDKKEDYDSDADNLILDQEEEKRVLEARQKKTKLALAAERFNKQGKDAFPFLQELKLLSEPLTPESVVNFFRATPGLDKKIVGAFLGGSKDFNVAVLQHFVDTFDFKASAQTAEGVPAHSQTKGMSIDVGLRGFLDCFVLPGEAQQIARIIESFANKYYEFCKSNDLHGPLADADAAYVLCYSVIMLNTDAHNPQVLKKMSKEAFIKNNKGINGGQDFPYEYLSDLYDSITKNEIKLTSDSLREFSDGTGSVFSNKKWNTVLDRSKQTGQFQTSVARAHGQHMFSLLWDSAIPIFEHYLFKMPAVYFQSKKNGVEAKIVQKIRQGFEDFSRICALYDVKDVFNNLIISLCKSLCKLLEEASENEEGRSGVCAFGRDSRARIACSILFTLVLEHGHTLILEGWTNVIHVILWLRHLNLLPQSLLEMEDFRDSKGQPLDSLRTNDSDEKAQLKDGDSSLTTAAVSFLSSAFSMIWATEEDEKSSDGSESGASQSPVPTDADKYFADRAFECIDRCEINSVFAATKYFQPGPLVSLIRALILVSTHGNGTDDSTISSEVFSVKILDQEAAVFCLERLSDVVEKNQSRMDDDGIKLWNIIQDHFATALKEAGDKPNYYLERVVVNLLRFSVRLLLHPEVTCGRMINLFSLLADLSPVCLKAFGSRITAGVLIFLETHAEHISSVEGWKTIFVVLLKFRDNPRVANSAFQTLNFVIDTHVSFASFAPVLQTLLEFIKPTDDVNAWQPVNPLAVLDSLLSLHRKLDDLGQKISVLNVDGLEGDVGRLQKMEFERKEAERTDLWLYSLQGFCNLCGDSRPEVRRRAMECLQGALLSTQVNIESALAWRICFEKLLIPLLDHIARFRVDPASSSPTAAKTADGANGMTGQDPNQTSGPFDIRLKGATVLFQTFLHKLEIVASLPDFHIFWLKFIGSMERHMKGAPGESVSVHFTESLKNILLVMHASGTFDHASKRSGQDLWAVTWAVIDSFRPELRYQLMQTIQNDAPQRQAGPATSQIPASQAPVSTVSSPRELQPGAPGRNFNIPLMQSSQALQSSPTMHHELATTNQNYQPIQIQPIQPIPSFVPLQNVHLPPGRVDTQPGSVRCHQREGSHPSSNETTDTSILPAILPTGGISATGAFTI